MKVFISLYKSLKQYAISNLLLISCALLPIATYAQNNSIEVEKFFKNSQFNNAKLSPDGKFIAMLTADNQDRVMLSVMDVSTIKPKIIVHNPANDVAFFHWVNNQRLVFGLTDLQQGASDTRSGPGLFAINRDGSNERQLVQQYYSTEPQKSRQLLPKTRFADVSHIENSDDIFVTQSTGTRNNPAATLLKLNTVTGQSEGIQSPSNTVGFLIDKSGQLRVATTNYDGLTAVHYKDQKNNQWRKLIEYDAKKDDGFNPEFISPDGSLYVTAHQSQNTTSLYRFDLESNKIEDAPIISFQGFDFTGSFLFNKKENKLIGIRYETDAPGTLWFNEDRKKLQQKIDAFLPNTVNNITGATSDDSDIFLVHSFSDVHPGTYLLFNQSTSKFTPLGDSHPDISSQKMSYKDFVIIKARDGQEIPAYVTLPKNSSGKNLPLIVMVHGGPYVRGVHWKWNPEVQFLSSRGYAVIEPEFRGSTGYGNKLYKSGWKQWGLKMQDDVDDTRKWAIEQGYADPQRVCIAGASYGGYAVLMGLIRNPELYRCGISWVGVSDINLLYDVSWSDQAGSGWQKYGMPVLIGDQDKDADQLKATSPLIQASRLNSPLILAYGAVDRRVPLVHGNKLYDAIKNHNKDVEWIVYPEEAHGWRLLKNNVDFWTRVDKFLDKNIGKQ